MGVTEDYTEAANWYRKAADYKWSGYRAGETITPIAMSIMQQGLEQAMTQEELLDLTSYLKSIQLDWFIEQTLSVRNEARSLFQLVLE